MAVAFLNDRIPVPPGKGARHFDRTVTFQGKVRVAEVALRGFRLDFVGTDTDHHIDVVEVAAESAGAEGEIVGFRVDCQYADKNADDRYSGFVDVLVIADLHDA